MTGNRWPAIGSVDPGPEDPIQKIRDRFERFGAEVVEIVIDCARSPRAMHDLLMGLNLTPKPDLDSQLDALSYYVARGGQAQFALRARYEIWRGRMIFQPAPLAKEPAPQTEPRKEAGDSAPAELPGKLIHEAGYQGPERRIGLDRRKESDRRGKLDSVAKNRRYGGDRRKSKPDRRKSSP